MDDHVHVLLAPLAPHELHGILHFLEVVHVPSMQHEHKRFGWVWQDEYFDRIMRDDKEFAHKAAYIVGNPRKRWPEVQEYP
jgi:hypothetical protein